MACSPFSLPSSLQRPRGVGHSGAQPAGVEGGAAASPTVSAEGRGGGGRGEGDVSGLGDKLEGSTVLPVPTGDPELLGSMPATAEMACHPVGGALPRERLGRQLQEADVGTPTLGKQPHVLCCFYFPRVTLNYFLVLFVDIDKHQEIIYLSIPLISLN